ncbi:MAG: hypothetical protein ABIL06_10270 [Pseudomonadota bacterium]
MESFWFRYGANYCNCEDDLGCIIREFSKIILLFFGFYEAHVLNLQAAEFLVKCNVGKVMEAGPQLATDAFYENTKKQLESGGVPPEKAADLTAFLLSDASDGITGKFLPAPWDAWQEEAFQESLRTDKDFATLRRIDDKTFFKFK